MTTVPELGARTPAAGRETGGPERPEDLRLVTGRGRYADDLPAPGALHLALVRSPYAHARVGGIDASAALAVPGVRAVLTGRELLPELRPFPNLIRSAPDYYPLAVDAARYAGEPVAAVLADDRYLAEDGAGLVLVDYEELPVVVDPEAAAREDAPLLHEQSGDNVLWRRAYRYGDAEAAFAEADRVVSIETRFPKYNSTPLETSCVVADWDRAAGTARIVSNFQGPYSLQPVLCRALGLETHELTLAAAEDVGGSFGIKAMLYPYLALAAVCSKVSGRPVKWVEDRQEHLFGSASGTNRVTRAQAAVTEEGVVTAVRLDLLEDVGAYLRAPEPSCVMRTITMYAGPYAIASADIDVRVVVTNKLPTGLNRGYGGQQHIFTLERLMDAVAAECGIDPVELRRRNLLRKEAFPHRTASGTLYDSGDYEAALDLALERSGYAELRARADDPAAPSWVGVGVATAVHSSAANLGYVTLALEAATRSDERYRHKSGSREWARLAVDPSGAVVAEIGSAGCGQGHRETIRNLVAELLGLPAGRVVVGDALDTSRHAWSVSSGSYSSRFAVMAGNAALLAADGLRDQLVALAAELLDVPVEEVVWVDGAGQHPRSGRSVPLKELAGAVHWNPGSLSPSAPALSAEATFMPEGLGAPDEHDGINAALAYGFMADVAVVEIDKRTLVPRLRSYVAVHDVGRALEPAIVRGQVRGGVLHGMGGALYEHLDYAADGQFRSGTLADYRCPTAMEAPEVLVEHVNCPSPGNPLGVKGAGESSAMAAPAAIASAIEHALRDSAVRVDELPVDGARLWALVGAGEATA